MKTAKTVIMTMIVAIAMIGMTGLAMAGSTTQTYVGDGTYTTSWNGNGGTMDIDTYTGNGRDHLSVDFENGWSRGGQAVTTNGWTEIDRSATTCGIDTSISAATLDNSGNRIVVDASADRGFTRLNQRTYIDDDAFGYDITGVASFHQVSACGRNPDVTVYTRAGDARTVVDLDNGWGYVRIAGAAVAGSGYEYAATGQCFSTKAYGHGDAVIMTRGDYVGVGIHVTNDGHSYPADVDDGGVLYKTHDEYDRRYRSSGCIYAVDLPVS